MLFSESVQVKAAGAVKPCPFFSHSSDGPHVPGSFCSSWLGHGRLTLIWVARYEAKRSLCIAMLDYLISLFSSLWGSSSH